MTTEVVKALTAIKSKGSFATELICESDGFHIAIDGIGALRFPISQTTAIQLSALARPAPFGRRSQTLLDKSVRDTGEIGREKIKIDMNSWQRMLMTKLELIQKNLGLSGQGRLEVVPDKLLVYGAGQFFAPHQDSERSDEMIGSLLVELPSDHVGGELVVQHHTKKKIFRGPKLGSKEISLIAFYADCHHEVKPVKSGFRVTLSCHLMFRSEGVASELKSMIGTERLCKSIKSYFSSPIKQLNSDISSKTPNKLVYLLDYEYTQHSLRFGQLKNADRERVRTLACAAETLNCEIYLALADVHECWSCEDDGWDRGYRRGRFSRRYYDEDAENSEEKSDSNDYELIELIESTVELRHFVDLKGKIEPNLVINPMDCEVCFTLASNEMTPFQSEHEGYMGNYGNTVDRWYHRDAVVIWPKDKDFAIRAKGSPTWAIKELRALIKKGRGEEAGNRAKELLPFWKTTAMGEINAKLFKDVLSIALAVENDTAFALLTPFGPHCLNSGATPGFIDLINLHGLNWAQQLFIDWTSVERYDQPKWLFLLPSFSEVLNSSGATGKSLAIWLLYKELVAFKKRHIQGLGAPVPFRNASNAKQHLADLLALLTSAAGLKDSVARDKIIDIIVAPETELPPVVACEFLKLSIHSGNSVVMQSLGLHRFYQHVKAALESAIAAPERRPDNWSMNPPSRCKCELCGVLSNFLRSSTLIRFEWPLAKERRRHIHSIIDSHELPVSHTTLRKGSPHKLVLIKEKALFDREELIRQRQQECLAWLVKHAGSFNVATYGEKTAEAAKRMTASQTPRGKK